MRTEENSTGKQDNKTAEEHSTDWTDARMATQAVAFRVIGVNQDSAAGTVPIWAPSPLTAEEEAVLARLTDIH